MHPNLRFTFELFEDGKLAFLDTMISIKGGNFESWVYRKKTNTDVMLNAFSNCPENWKKGLVSCFLNRAWIVCSTRDLFMLEIDKLRNIFRRNGYTLSFFNKLFSDFMNRKEPSATETPALDINSVSDDDDDEKRYVLVIPFIGKPSLLFRNQLTKLFSDELKVKLRCVFDCTKVSSYFSLKTRTSDCLLSNVTYKYTCQCDTDKFYIGETKRYIVERASEHLAIKKFPLTAVGKHISDCDACLQSLSRGDLSYKNFEIVNKCKSKLECEVREAFLVKKLNPSMNLQLFKSGAMHTLRIFN